MLSMVGFVSVQTTLFRVVFYMFALLYIYFPFIPCVDATVEELLEKGTHFLAAGRLSDALSLYMQAVAEDPKNHITVFRRGTAHLAMGNVRLALPDFEEAVRLNEHFIPAIIQKANVNLKLGKLEEAKKDFDTLWTTYKHDESREKLVLVKELELDIERASNLHAKRQWAEALQILDRLIDVIQFNHRLREMRAQCFFQLGDAQKGIHEMRYSVHLLHDNREGLLNLAELMYASGLAVQALEEIRECLRLDQEHTGCKKLFRKLKKLSTAITKAQSSLESSSYSDCIKHANEIMDLEPSNHEYQNQAKILLCQCHARSQSEAALDYCKDVAKEQPQNFDLQCDLAESYINVNQYDKAIEICQKILESERRHQRAKDLMKKAQNLLKAVKRPDYYKILGVSRGASKQEITRAYRKMAKLWHPDKFDGDKKEEAQAKFLQLGTAKEVLMDDEMRRRYDSGEDPMDQTQQYEQHYANPFGPFGGFTFGGGQFEFHFG